MFKINQNQTWNVRILIALFSKSSDLIRFCDKNKETY